MKEGTNLMGMAYLFMLIIYSTVAIVVYKLVKLQTDNVWIKRGVVAYNVKISTQTNPYM